MNKNLWNMYKSSQEGKDFIEKCNPDNENFFSNMLDVVDATQALVKAENISDRLINTIDCIDININESNYLATEKKPWTRELFEKFIENLDIKDIKEDNNGVPILVNEDNAIIIKKGDYRRKCGIMLDFSICLYFYYDIFKPMLWPTHFNYLLKCCDVLDIDMPDMPRSKDYKDYLMYYYDICVAWKSFQEENSLTDAEFCACLYGFAPMYMQNTEKTELPQPTNVWLTGAGGKADFIYLDTLGEGCQTEQIWSCDERTRRGDIIVMYCTSPRSYIHSIWRADSGGMFNPFDYYHCRTTICNGIETPHITFNDLKQDTYFANVPIVRRNLQGVNGIELSSQDYNELIRLIKEKGSDTPLLPRLFVGEQIDFGEIKLEKDVEENILIPLLNKLGYTEQDWDRQLSQKAGRGLKAIPDFVFFPKGEKHFASAPMVIEAKLDMSSVIELQKAFKQGLSYARMLRSQIMGICDKERLILYAVNENGKADIENPIFENHWQTIYNDEVIGGKLSKLIGREVITNM